MIAAPSIGDHDGARRDRSDDRQAGGADREHTVVVVDDDDAILEALGAMEELLE